MHAWTQQFYKNCHTNNAHDVVYTGHYYLVEVIHYYLVIQNKVELLQVC